MSDKPVHSRDPLGRHKVDLRRIRSPWLRYGLAAFVVTVIVGLAWWSGRDTALAEGDFAWLVPWLGWGVVILVVVAFGLRVLGRNRPK